MSKIKSKKEYLPSKTKQSTNTNNRNKKNHNMKKKKKQWFETKLKKKKLLSEAKLQQAQPPKDAQQFSANWKILQEVRVC